jgi:putative flippase GtrA
MAFGAELVGVGVYGLVGAISAALHALLLLLLPRLAIPLPLANLAGFLVASLWSYGAHAKFSFRRQTRGQAFPRRWLLFQLTLNVALSLLLPWLLAPWVASFVVVLVLVFTPTAVNYGVWSLAARQVAGLQRPLGPAPIRHADDLGLHPAINRAIFSLADRGLLQSASLMVGAPAVADAIDGLKLRPDLPVCLHLVLSEGPPMAPVDQIPLLLDREGLLKLGFVQLLWASVWPFGHSRRLAQQLAIELEAQIRRFVDLTACHAIHLDGHQHLHLLPVVWRQLLNLDPFLRPVWLRTVREPWPAKVPLGAWGQSLVSAGGIKWLVLSLLTLVLKPVLHRQGLSTNASFAGVLFTGRMAGATLVASERHLRSIAFGSAGTDAERGQQTPPMLLIHPASANGGIAIDPRYRHSASFYASPWRQREYESLLSLGLLDRC